MKKLIILLLLLLMPFAYADEYFDYQTLELELTIDNNIEIIPEASNYYTDYIKANLLYFPIEDYRQTVTSMETVPNSDIGNNIEFIWDSPPNKVFFSVDSKIETSAKLKQVRNKINFPLRNIPNDLVEYINPEKIIDITPEIKQLASTLVEGKDDLYKVVFELAAWTEKNIEYNLSTSNVEASEKASWVLENRQGVCDELTSLFISMVRSLGIPAKFVSGIAYTNSDAFDEPWGAHGWAEVYFPEVGWVPFDVTYGQLGFIDAGHIKLREGLDARESSVLYEYVGRNIDLETSPLDFDTKVLSVGDKLIELLKIDTSIYEDIVGFGSFNLITVSLRNRQNYYVAEELTLARTTGITVLDSYKKIILLAPGEEKKVYWIIKVDQDLDHRSIYTFPIHVYSSKGFKSETEFRAQYEFTQVEYKNLELLLSLDKETAFMDDILLICEPDDYEIYYYEKATINCILKNQGNLKISNLEVCLDEKCNLYNMDGIKEISFTFQKEFEDLGLKTLPIVAKTDLFQKTNYVTVNVVDEPALYLDEIKTPGTVNFDDSFSIDFYLKRKSASFPRNVIVELSHQTLRHEWEFEMIQKNQRFRLNTEGKMLMPGENTFTLDIQFEDDEGEIFMQSEQFFITLEDTTLFQKAFVYTNKLGIGVERILNNKEDQDRFLQSPKTWIIIGGIIVGLLLMKLVLYVERKKGKSIPYPRMPK